MSGVKISLAVLWEGRNLNGVDYVNQLRSALPSAPITHYMSAAYFCRGGRVEDIIAAMAPAFRGHDEVCLQVLPWLSLRGHNERREETVIAAADPNLIVEYPGIDVQEDCDYTRPISAYSQVAIDSYVVTSKLLLRPLLAHLIKERGLSVDRILRGIRAGHGLASDRFLSRATAAGFLYDGSGMDGGWARAALESGRPLQLFAPLVGMWGSLWGGREHHDDVLRNTYVSHATAGTGVHARSQPFVVATEAGRIVEIPLNAGLLPPLVSEEVERAIVARLESLDAGPSFLSFGFHQETASGVLDDLLKAEVLSDPRVEWTTNIDWLVSLASAQVGAGGALSLAERARTQPIDRTRRLEVPPVVVPEIRVPGVQAGVRWRP